MESREKTNSLLVDIFSLDTGLLMGDTGLLMGDPLCSSYVMHGDRSLNVDRLSILQTKLIERFGSKLEGEIIQLTQFYVMEKAVRPSFVKTPAGKQIAYNGSFLPTLISEITISLKEDYFHGSAMFQLKQGSKSTHSALTIATTMAVDDLIKDMERSWKPH